MDPNSGRMEKKAPDSPCDYLVNLRLTGQEPLTTWRLEEQEAVKRHLWNPHESASERQAVKLLWQRKEMFRRSVDFVILSVLGHVLTQFREAGSAVLGVSLWQLRCIISSSSSATCSCLLQVYIHRNQLPVVGWCHLLLCTHCTASVVLPCTAVHKKSHRSLYKNNFICHLNKWDQTSIWQTHYLGTWL